MDYYNSQKTIGAAMIQVHPHIMLDPKHNCTVITRPDGRLFASCLNHRAELDIRNQFGYSYHDVSHDDADRWFFFWYDRRNGV